MSARSKLIAVASASILGMSMPSHAGMFVDIPVPGTEIRLRDATGPLGRRTHVTLNVIDFPPPTLDPRLTGATLYIARLGVGGITALQMPAEGWSGTGAAPSAFKYKSRSGAVVAARIVGGRFLRLSARGEGAYPLGGVSQGGVGLIFDFGGLRFCGFFGGTITKDDGRTFRAVDAVAPDGCPPLGAP
jgi:hypothetical protein